jgi:hypothetical protein
MAIEDTKLSQAVLLLHHSRALSSSPNVGGFNREHLAGIKDEKDSALDSAGSDVGHGFQWIAIINWSGLARSAAEDDKQWPDPTTSLVGTKAGKKIARGEKVTLKVRTRWHLSNEFSFTRPFQ